MTHKIHKERIFIFLLLCNNRDVSSSFILLENFNNIKNNNVINRIRNENIKPSHIYCELVERYIYLWKKESKFLLVLYNSDLLIKQ